MQFLCKKHLGALRPVDQAGVDAIQKLKPDSMVMIELKQPRNPQHHRKFFAMLNIVFQNQEYYKSLDTLLAACKLATGHADIVRTKRGDVALPKSIAFHSLSQADFEVFYEASVKWVIEDVIPNLERADLDAEIAQEFRGF